MDNKEEMLKKMIENLQWEIDYHSKKLEELKLQMEILTSKK